MSKIDDMLHSVGLHSLAVNPEQEKMDTGEEIAIPLDTAYAPTRPTRIMTGPRGRDPGGYPKVIPAGLPPAVFGEFRRVELGKDLEVPKRPFNTSEHIAVPVTANTGDIIDLDVSFPVRTLMIDNYSHVWIYVDGCQRWLPPLTCGWCIPIWRAQSKIHISANAPGGHAQIAVTAGDVINVIAVEEKFAYSPGIAVPTG